MCSIKIRPAEVSDLSDIVNIINIRQDVFFVKNENNTCEEPMRPVIAAFLSVRGDVLVAVKDNVIAGVIVSSVNKFRELSIANFIVTDDNDEVWSDLFDKLFEHASTKSASLVFCRVPKNDDLTILKFLNKGFSEMSEVIVTKSIADSEIVLIKILIGVGIDDLVHPIVSD